MNTEVETRGEFRPADTPAPTPVLDQVVAATPRQTLIGRAADFLGTKPAMIFDLLRGVWPTGKNKHTGDPNPPLSNEEITSGLALIARYELDPFAKEIYVTRSKGKALVIIGIDGWVKVVDRTPGYDGFEVEIKWKDEAETQAEWVETRIFSTKRSHPAVYRAFAREYAKVSGVVADDLPIHMLRIFSFHHAVRLFTPIGGATSVDEARWMVSNQPTEDPTISDLLNGGRDVPTVGETETETKPEPKLPEDKVPFGAGKPGPDEDLIDRQASEFVEMFDNAKDVQQVGKLRAMIRDDEIIQASPKSIARVQEAVDRAAKRLGGRS